MIYSTAKAVCNVCGRTTTAIGRLFHQDSCRERATARIYKRRHWSILENPKVEASNNNNTGKIEEIFKCFRCKSTSSG